MTRWALIDCENLTSPRHVGWAARWKDFEHVELYGRLWAVARWRSAFRRHPAREIVIPADAPPQAADTLIQARLAALAAQTGNLIVLASNDSDFAPDVERATAQGAAVEWARDPRSSAEAIRQAVRELGRDGQAPAAAVGELLLKRYGIRAKGRLRALVQQAGGAVVGEKVCLIENHY